MSTARARLMRRARRYLSIWKENIGLDNELGLTDINKDAEDFCCGLLNIMLDADLQNLNLLQMNFPAVDLADGAKGLCVQVTSTAGSEKITHTLDRFFAHSLEAQYSRVIVLILGKKKKYRTEFPRKEGFCFDPARDIWDIPKLLTELAGLDMTRLNRVDAYLREQFDDLGELQPPMDLPVLSALDDPGFLGREAELAEISRRFEAGERFVILSGLGGMGKTELAARFASTRWGGESYLVRFERNWVHTVVKHIAPNLRGVDVNTTDTARVYRDAMMELQDRSKDELLILDNVDQIIPEHGDKESMSLEQLKLEMSCLNMRILVTSRNAADGAIDVARLHRQELHQLFAQHDSAVTPEQRDALIDAVNGHTLTVDLMARSLRRDKRRAATADKLLKNLSDPSIRQVATTYQNPQSRAQAQIIDHLKVVFRVLDLPEIEQKLLRCASLLPDGGMDDRVFISAFGEDQEVTLDQLIDNGWLIWKDDLLQIHPVIRKVCREELPPTEKICIPFIGSLIQYYRESPYHHIHYRQIAELLTAASALLPDPRGNLAIWAGIIWDDLGAYAQALDCKLQATERQEAVLSPDDPYLATAYNNLGFSYGNLGEHQKALDFHLKALAIREKVLPQDHPDLASSYNNVGYTYGNLGDHQKGLDFQVKALAIREKVLPQDHPDLAQSYNNMGYTYGMLGEHQKELDYKLKALVIREKVLPQDHPDLAQSYNNVGCTYGKLGDHQKELDYKLKALAIWEKVLPQDHPVLASSYNNVGCTYGELGDHQKELAFKLKALVIREKVLPQDHPDLALSYNNVACTYYRLGDLPEAVWHMRRAAEIIVRSSLPETHPDRIDYPKWAELLEQILNV